VRSRLLHSLVPFNPKFHDISEQSPDLYGPFWIYTTLVFIIAAAGSLAKYIKEDSSKNFFQEFVPLAAGIVNLDNLDIWNRLWIASYSHNPDEMFWLVHFLPFCSMHLWLLIFCLHSCSNRLFCTD
jgi:hypothetical protein